MRRPHCQNANHASKGAFGNRLIYEGGGGHAQVRVLLLPRDRATPDRPHPRACVRKGPGINQLCDAEAAVTFLRVFVRGVDAPVDDKD